MRNMLPHVPKQAPGGGGQGPVTFYAFATDLEGQRVLLGTKAVTLINDQATTPFGAIHTPAQSGTVSRTSYANFGWALASGSTAMIPSSGSTVNVFADGAPLGAVDYNHCRGTVGPTPPAGQCNDDVARLFPGARNITHASGAMGLFVIDTTALANDLHSIAWGVTDDQNRTAGTGSRFFNVLNGVGTLRPARLRVAAAAAHADGASLISGGGAVYVRTGLVLGAPFGVSVPEADGICRVSVPMLGRVELQFGGAVDGAH